MTSTHETRRRMSPPDGAPRRTRKRHAWRWVLGIIVIVVLLVVGAMRAFMSESGPAPLVLPAGGPAAQIEGLDGTWEVGAGSVGGFRVYQSGFGEGGDVVGRTEAVTGTMILAGDEVTSATFEIDLLSIAVGGKPQPQFAASLDTAAFPVATFTLVEPATLATEFATGETVQADVVGELAMRGTSRPVTLAVSGRRDGAALHLVGSTPIEFSDWDITVPTGYGILGSVADHGVAEVLLVLTRR